MKRLLSLLFLFVFLFNVGGYYIMYWGLRYQANKELRQNLDAGIYAESQLITLKLPITLPYQIDRNYERVDGEFEYKGEFYKLVKQQIKRDTLYIICLKDQRVKQLVGEMNNFTRLANDLPVSSKTYKLFGTLFKDYNSASHLELSTRQFGWSTSPEFNNFFTSLSSPDIAKITPPPRVI
ncbi:MAG: hypothetical protein JJE09_04160 [Bacteroidia bacterium]|nr:hypothetical protein [Bacteroidia bacterium]